MSHLPVNHHLRPLYRALAALTGVVLVAFGLAGLSRDGSPKVFGAGANAAACWFALLLGLLEVLATFVGRNVDRTINLVSGPGLIGIGLLMLALLQTDANVFDFSVATCNATFIAGLVLMAAGLYGRAGSEAEQIREEQFRHNVRPDPQSHPWQNDT